MQYRAGFRRQIAVDLRLCGARFCAATKAVPREEESGADMLHRLVVVAGAEAVR